MKILAIEKENPGLKPGDFQPYLEDEAKMVWSLKNQRIIREIYFTRENHTAVLVLECSDAETARRHLDALPLVKNGCITFEVSSLSEYTGFERLFDEIRIREVLRNCWSKATSPLYDPDDPARGQCCVTALVLNDFFGGEILKTPMDQQWHFYNRIQGKIYDFTRLPGYSGNGFQHFPSNWDEAMEEISPCQFGTLKSRFQELYIAS